MPLCCRCEIREATRFPVDPDEGEMPMCNRCFGAEDDEESRDDDYEREVARARQNDFKRTGGRDWT